MTLLPGGAPPRKLPAVGARVRCEGLTGAVELNGCLGRVVSHEGERARVRMDGPGCCVVGVRPQNLVVVIGLLDLLALSDMFREEVLRRLDPADRATLAQVGKVFLAAVAAAATEGGVASDLPWAGKSAGVPLKLQEFCGAVAQLAWAKANGCPWEARTCVYAALGGHLQVLRWAREHGCPWDSKTCAAAAAGGHLEVLRWALGCHCPWDANTCMEAAGGGHLEVLRWAREHQCPWDRSTCSNAARRGHLEVLKWAREHHCPWDARARAGAAAGGHAEVLRWLDEHGAP